MPAAHRASRQAVRITPLRLSLNDEGLAADRELIVGPWVDDLARPQLEGRGLGMGAGQKESRNFSHVSQWWRKTASV
jgi:hypothetical protein